MVFSSELTIIWTTIAMIAIIVILLPAMVLSADFDPDKDICDKPALDAAVYADTNVTYLFKGNYYWITEDLTEIKGIQGFANLIADKWPPLKGPIKAAFVIPESNKLLTVLVQGNRWYGFRNYVKIMDGSTDSWPGFNRLKVTLSVELKRGSSTVVFLHKGNTLSTSYNFATLGQPDKDNTTKALTRDKNLFFLEDKKSLFTEGITFDIVCNASAAIVYDKLSLFISEKNFCIVDTGLGMYEKKCDSEGIQRETKNLLNCPLDLTDRPTVPTNTGAESVTESPNDTVSNTIKLDSNLTTMSTTVRPVPAVSDANNTTASPQVWDENLINYYVYAYIGIHAMVTIVVLVLLCLISMCTKKSKGNIVYLNG